jgi:hypothetical protein
MPQLGYILNIYDAINFDIGLEDITYRGILCEKYHYRQHEKDCTGISYRCRLKGIEYKPNVKYTADYKKSKLDIVQLIDRLNGWMVCRWFSVDTYKRLIIQLTDPITDENLSSYLLEKFPDTFQRYRSGGKRRITELDRQQPEFDNEDRSRSPDPSQTESEDDLHTEEYTE